jgi:hypothetical protein
MKNSIFFLLLALLASFNGKAQNCESSAYPANSDFPDWATSLAWGQGFGTADLNEWGFVDLTVPYRDIVKLRFPGTSFGLTNTGTGRAVVQMFDLEVTESLAVLGQANRSRDALIYGARVVGSSSSISANYWTESLRNYGTFWNPVLGNVTIVNHSSGEYRKRARIVENNFNRELDDNDAAIFKAWGGIMVNVRIVVSTYGSTRIRDCEFHLPGILESRTVSRVLTCADFQTEYRTRPDAWGEPGQVDSHPTMTWDADSHELEITANQNVTNFNVEVPGTVLEVWGKMLTYDDGIAPEINSSYNYGLWVAGEIVTEDFKMWPRNDDTDTWPAWPDYVFADTYELPTLKEMAAHVHAHGHLPGVPSAAAIKEGYSQHEINRVFLEKIEQLTLYKIDHRQRLQYLRAELEADQKRIAALQLQLGKN